MSSRSAGKLLILHANSSMEGVLRAALERKLGSGLVHDAKSGPLPPDAFCIVTTLHAATGLEAPVVMLRVGNKAISTDMSAQSPDCHSGLLGNAGEPG